MKARKGREVKQICRIMGIERKWKSGKRGSAGSIHLHLYTYTCHRDRRMVSNISSDRISLSLIHVDPWI